MRCNYRKITGEGKIDGQTAQGKLIRRLCRRAAQFGKPVIALCGRLEAGEAEIRQIGLRAAYAINGPEEKSPLPELLRNTARNLRKTANRVFSESGARIL